MTRKLGGFEQTWALMDDFVPVLFVGVLHLANGPDPDTLRQALDVVQKRYPLLRASIVKHDGAPHFSLTDKPKAIPLVTVDRAAADQWREIAEDELNTALDASVEPLIRCTYLHSAGESDLVFTIHHTIIDSRSGMELIDDIMAHCAAITAGIFEGAPNDAPMVSPPMEALYPRRLAGLTKIRSVAAFLARQMTVEATYRLRLGKRQKIHGDANSKCRIEEFELTREATGRLVRQTRRRGMPLNSLLHAAMLKSVAEHRYRGRTLPMRGISFADMRPYLEPPPSADGLGVYISMLPYTVTMTPQAEVWKLAGEIGKEIYKATKHDDKFIAPMLSKQMVQMFIARRTMRLGMTALSYVGPVRLHERYGPIKVTGLSGFVSNNVLGPELAAFGALLHGRLKMDFLYLDRDMSADEAREIIQDIEAILVMLANETTQAAT